MTLRELRDWIDTLPEIFDEYIVVHGEVGIVNEDDDGEEMFYRADNPIVSLYVDQQTEEFCLFHQTQENVEDIIKRMTDGDSEDTEG